MGQRLLIIIAIAALGAVAYWATLDKAEVQGDGLEVNVHVVDADGKPVPGAQVRRRFTAEIWQAVDANGSITLRGLPLHEGHAPSASSLAAAVSVRARFLAMQGEPTVTQTGAAWNMTVHLAAHGVVRLSIATTHLAPVKAWIEADPSGRIEAMGGRNVARQDQDAAFRIMPGLNKLVVRVAGSADPLGIIRVASQRLEYDAPGVGVVSQIEITPEEARPIAGEIRIADASNAEGSVAIEAGGEVVMRMIENDKPTYELGRVPIEAGGTFFIPFSGLGPYALTAHRPLYATGPMKVAAGEAEVMLFLGTRLPILRLTHREVDPKRRLAVSASPSGERSQDWLVGKPQQERTWTRVVFNKPPRAVTVRASAPGTQAKPPLEGRLENVEMASSGETEAQIELKEMPFATVTLNFPGAPKEAMGTAQVQGRRVTILPSIKHTVVLKHVQATGSAIVRVMWRDRTHAAQFVPIALADGGAVAVDIPYVKGGFVSWDGPMAGTRHVMQLRRADTTDTLLGTVPMSQHEGEWRTEHALAAGKHLATINGTEVAFTVTAGQTVRAQSR